MSDQQVQLRVARNARAESLRTLKARVLEAKRKTARARSRYKNAKTHEVTVGKELAEVRSALDTALDTAFSAGILKEISVVPSPRLVAHVPPYLCELLVAFPLSGTITLDSLRSNLGFSSSTLNSRLQNAKKLDLVASTGRAEYSLTLLGLTNRKI